MSKYLIDTLDEIDVSKLRLIRDYVLIRTVEKLMTTGGVYLPRADESECSIGGILAVGSGVENPRGARSFPMDLRPGQIALTMDYAGEKMALRGGKYRIIRTHGVWATLTLADERTYEIAAIEPRMSCVVVEPDAEPTSRGGVLLPKGEDATCANRWATVMAVGPGPIAEETGERVPMEVKSGDRVLMMRYAGANIRVGGKDLRIIEQGDIRCVQTTA